MPSHVDEDVLRILRDDLKPVRVIKGARVNTAAIREALECQVQLRAAGGAEMHPDHFSAAPRSDFENRGRALRYAEVFEPKYRFNHIGRAGRPAVSLDYLIGAGEERGTARV